MLQALVPDPVEGLRYFQKHCCGMPYPIFKKYLPARLATASVQFFGSSRVILVPHPKYLPDLAHCEFVVFAKIRCAKRGNSRSKFSKQQLKSTTCWALWCTQNYGSNIMVTSSTECQRCLNYKGEYLEKQLNQKQPQILVSVKQTKATHLTIPYTF